MVRHPMIALVMAAGLAGCTVAPQQGLVEFSAPPERSVPAETVRHSETAFVAVPPEALIPWIIDAPLEDVFDATGSLPAVAGTKPLTRDWGKAGSQRRVLLGDGHQAAEIILTVNRGRSFTYQVYGFTTSASLLANYAIGTFEAVRVPGGSQLTWTYSFAPKSGLTRVPLGIFVSKEWSAYMGAAMANMKRMAESELGARRKRITQ